VAAEQWVDDCEPILITHFYAKALPIDPDQELWVQLWVFIGTGYAFKLIAALIDTVPFVLGTRYMVRYLRLEPTGS
jgi:queuosine precursor transporter